MSSTTTPSLPDFPFLKKLAAAIKKDITIYDLETSGFVNAKNFAIVEIALINITQDGRIETKSALINPMMPIPKEASDVHHITDDMVKNASTFEKFIPYLTHLFGKNLVAGYNSLEFDNMGVVKEFNRYSSDTQEIFAKDIFKDSIDIRTLYMKDTACVNGLKGKLEEVARHYNVTGEGVAHRASFDTFMTASILEKIVEKNGIEFATSSDAYLGSKEFLSKFNKEKNKGSVSSFTNASSDGKRTYMEEQIFNFISNSPVLVSSEDMLLRFKIDDNKLSFLVSNLLKSNFNDLAPKLSQPEVQEFLKANLDTICNTVWVDEGIKGKLKPVFEYLKQNHPELNIDYTQIRIGMHHLESQSQRSRPKP